MKRILVPTDFSANADNAVQFALHIARQFGAEATLLHSFLIGSKRADVFKDLGRVIREEAEGNLQRSLKKFHPLLSGEATLNGRVVEGSAVQSTANYAEEHDCNLIVMGTQGATGALEVFLGSTTGGVMKSSSVPVLAVPSHYAFQPLRNIVLALSNEPLPDEDTFQPLKKLAHAFDARVNVFHLRQDEESPGVDRRIGDYLDGVEVAFHEEANGDDVYERINAFARERNASLLCMVRRKRGFFANLFRESATLKQVYNSPVPLLVLMAE